MSYIYISGDEGGGRGRLVLIPHVFTVSIPPFNKQTVQHFTRSHDLHMICASQSTNIKNMPACFLSAPETFCCLWTSPDTAACCCCQTSVSLQTSCSTDQTARCVLGARFPLITPPPCGLLRLVLFKLTSTSPPVSQDIYTMRSIYRHTYHVIKYPEVFFFCFKTHA